MRIGRRSLTVDVELDSDDADVSVRDYRFDTDLDLAIRLRNENVLENDTGISGTYLKLTDARLLREGRDGAEPSHDFAEGWRSAMAEARRPEEPAAVRAGLAQHHLHRRRSGQ